MLFQEFLADFLVIFPKFRHPLNQNDAPYAQPSPRPTSNSTQIPSRNSAVPIPDVTRLVGSTRSTLPPTNPKFYHSQNLLFFFFFHPLPPCEDPHGDGGILLRRVGFRVMIYRDNVGDLSGTQRRRGGSGNFGDVGSTDGAH